MRKAGQGTETAEESGETSHSVKRAWQTPVPNWRRRSWECHRVAGYSPVASFEEGE